MKMLLELGGGTQKLMASEIKHLDIKVCKWFQ